MAKEEKKKEKDGVSSEGRDQKIASTGEATSSSLHKESSSPSTEAAKPSGEATSSSLHKESSSSSTEAAKPSEPAAKPTEPDWKDLYARLRADFDNFKKRTARDREDTYRYAESDILKDILPTVDNLALALANATTGAKPQDGAKPTGEATSPSLQEKSPEDSNSAFVTGVQLVYDTLLKSLKDHGAEPFDCVGQDLDTEKMEAIATLPSPTVAEGKVSNEVKRGWMLKGKVLRAAQVVVSSGKQ